MRYLALACDYDGTIASQGLVSDDVVWALATLRGSGRKLLLVTGRELEPLREVFPHLDLFDRVVAENGALLYRPESNEEKLLCEAPPPALVEELERRGVQPVSVGRGIIGTWQPHETTVVEAIRDLGLEQQVIFNKGAVMVLPAGVNKASGLAAALADLGLSPHNVVGVGDAENDHAFLASCECAVAVANALDALKERADVVTDADHGQGVMELVARLLEDDLADLEPQLARHHVRIGETADGADVAIPPHGSNVLLAGPSGSGKSTLATTFLEALAERGYQWCLVDPEGDYETFDGAVVLGDRDRAPTVEEVLQVLDRPEERVVVNLIGLGLDDRPPFFESLLPQLLHLRVRRGRPHFLVVDEAHHLLPAAWERVSQALPQELGSVLFITVHPEMVAAPVLQSVDLVLAVGDSPGDTFGRFAEAVAEHAPRDGGDLGSGEAALWDRRRGREAVCFHVDPSRQERRRHVRKYAEGDIGEEWSFYFRGPEEKLNLRASNLTTFLQLADGVDDDTWLHHLRQGDYSRWFRDDIKDTELADAAAEVERQAGELDADESRALIRKAIEKDYTLPA